MREKNENGSVRRVVGYAIVVFALIYLAINVIALAADYWGDEYASPGWDEYSVPPPKMY